jgi:hypothetical protein
MFYVTTLAVSQKFSCQILAFLFMRKIMKCRVAEPAILTGRGK